jgi:phosphohistidine swiveling domain-containing protein
MTWEKCYTRKYTVQRHEVLLKSFEQKFYDAFNADFRVLIVPEAGMESFYYEKEKWHPFAERIAYVILKDFPTFERSCTGFLADGEEFVATCKSVGAAHGDLSMLYREFYRNYLNYFSRGIWLPFILGPVIEREVMRELEKGDDAGRLVHAVFTPETENKAVQMQRDIANGEAPELLHEKYCWMPCYDLDDDPWDVEHFRSLEATAPEAVDIPDIPQNDICKIGRLHAYVKDRRDELRREGQWRIRPLYERIARALGMTLQEVVYLTHDEILHALSGKGIQRQDRIHGYTYEWSRFNHRIQAGSASAPPSEHEGELKGVCAMTGRASGRVAIVTSVGDLENVRHGDVLVAVSTHPDYISAMQRACAIVTDEGGISSHAAITARELRKPCIVGARAATKLLRDGDVVVIDADSATIKKRGGEAHE